MQKTKLGVSVAVLGAAMYFTGLFSGYVVAVVLAGYILLMEENEWLKKTAVKAVALMIAFSLLSTLLGLIPDVINFINSIFIIFDGDFSIPVVSKIVYMLGEAISLVRIVLFLLLGLKALHQGTIKVPVVDKLVNKSME